MSERTGFLDHHLSDLKGKFSVDQLAERVIGAAHIPAAYKASALLECVKKDIRRLIKRIKTPDGFPIWHSTTDTDSSTTEPIKRYKQLELFDRGDFARVWRFWDKTEKKARWMKERLQKYFSDRFHGENLKQLVLSFMKTQKPRVGLFSSADVTAEK